MKVSELKATIRVGATPKTFAIILSMLDDLYSGDRDRLIRQLVHYYRVTL